VVYRIAPLIFLLSLNLSAHKSSSPGWYRRNRRAGWLENGQSFEWYWVGRFEKTVEYWPFAI
jgi:hypothetical protein